MRLSPVEVITSEVERTRLGAGQKFSFSSFFHLVGFSSLASRHFLLVRALRLRIQSFWRSKPQIGLARSTTVSLNLNNYRNCLNLSIRKYYYKVAHMIKDDTDAVRGPGGGRVAPANRRQLTTDCVMAKIHERCRCVSSKTLQPVELALS